MSQRIDEVKNLEIVLKVAERCNINCSYCYMFNKGNEEYEDLPAYIRQSTVEEIAHFLADGARALNVKNVRIGLHGGEPLMIKKARYSEICDTFLRILAPTCNVEFTMQTNAVLVDEEWIAIFAKYNILIGVSIDGPREYNDVARLDHQGRSTYDGTLRGIKLLQEKATYLKKGVGALAVINPLVDAKKIYRHMIDELGIAGFDLLLPIETHDTFDASTLPQYGQYLCDAFDEWVGDNNPDIKIRMFNNILSYFSGGKDYVARYNHHLFNGWQLLTVDSNGGIGPDDALKPLNGGLFAGNVRDTSLVDFIRAPLMQDLKQAEEALPTACADCTWQNYCKGGGGYGRFANRYSRKNGFDNPSIFCGALKQLYVHVAKRMMLSGIPYERLVDSLDYSDSTRCAAPAAIRTTTDSFGGRKTIPIHAA